MLGFGAQQQYFIYQGSTDMRKGYYGLSGLVRGCYEVFHKQITARQSPISYQHLVMLLSGISLVGTRQRKRYKMVAEG
ncbi:MAG: hypothetical protein ACKO6M_03690 [Bacteroidota bacterium]